MAGLVDGLKKNKRMKDDATLANLQSSMEGATGARIININIDQIDPMPGNELIFPYDDAIIDSIVQEIQENGFQMPITVVPKEDKRYMCVTGHQRIKAMQKLGKKYIPAEVKKDLSEKQMRDLWRADNIKRRKFTPLMYARLLQSYADDYDKYKAEYGITGGKKEYVASKAGIGKSQVARYALILQMPEYIQELCGETDFPYTVLQDASKFNEEQKILLADRLKIYRQKYPNLVIEAKELRKIIHTVEQESKYEDTSVEMYEADKKKDELKEYYNREYESFYNELERTTDQKQLGRNNVLLDEPLQTAARALFDAMQSKSQISGNATVARNNLHLLKTLIKEIEKKHIVEDF